MLNIAILDVKRILWSKAVWVLLLVGLTIMALQTLKWTAMGTSVNVSDLDASSFLPFLPPSTAPRFSEVMLVAGQISPLLQLMLSFKFLDYLALTAIVVFGGFFAQDISNNYALLRRCRGLSPRRHFAANALTIIIISFLFTTAGIAFLYAVCLVVNPQGVNSLTSGQLALDNIAFLPQVAGASPLAYVALFAILYTAVLGFLGMLGYVAARLSGNVLVASVVPTGFILIFGRLAPALPWPFRAFEYQTLSFAQASVVDFDFAIKYAGVYFIWLAAFIILGFLNPSTATTYRKARTWLTR